MRPVKYELDPEARVYVEERKPSGWAVTCDGQTLNHLGHWEHEPQPSARTPDYLWANRYPTAEAATLAWLKSLPVTERT